MMQRVYYYSDTSDPEMERSVLFALVGNGFHSRFVKTFEGVKIFGVKQAAADSDAEVEAAIKDLG